MPLRFFSVVPHSRRVACIRKGLIVLIVFRSITLVIGPHIRLFASDSTLEA